MLVAPSVPLLRMSALQRFSISETNQGKAWEEDESYQPHLNKTPPFSVFGMFFKPFWC